MIIKRTVSSSETDGELAWLNSEYEVLLQSRKDKIKWLIEHSEKFNYVSQQTIENVENMDNQIIDELLLEVPFQKVYVIDEIINKSMTFLSLTK